GGEPGPVGVEVTAGQDDQLLRLAGVLEGRGRQFGRDQVVAGGDQHEQRRRADGGQVAGRLVLGEHLHAAQRHLVAPGGREVLAGLGEPLPGVRGGQHRTTQRREPTRTTTADPDAALREWLRNWAKQHPRRGFRNACHDARGEGWTTNHKKIQRLWREEGLRVPQRRRRKRLGTSTAPDLPKADAPNMVWAVDFQFDATTDGRPIKIVSIVDEHTRECLGGLVERSITADTLIDELDRIAQLRGYPAVLRCDN